MASSAGRNWIDLTRDSDEDEDDNFVQLVSSSGTAVNSSAAPSAKQVNGRPAPVVVDLSKTDDSAYGYGNNADGYNDGDNDDDDDDDDEEDEELIALKYPNGRPARKLARTTALRSPNNLMDLSHIASGFVAPKPPQSVLDSIIPLQMGNMVLFGIYPVRLIPTGLYQPPVGMGFLDPVTLSQERDMISHMERFHAHSQQQINVGYVEQRASQSLSRLAGDPGTIRFLQITAGIPLWHHSPQRSPNIPLFVMIYGQVSLWQTLSKIIQFHGVQLLNRKQAVDSMNPPPPSASSITLMPTMAGITAGYNSAGQRMTTSAAQDYAFKQMEEIFSSIKGAESLPLTDAPDRLQSRLYPHQKMALTFLLEREKPHHQRSKDSIVGSFWKRAQNHNGAEFFHNILTNETSVVPPDEVKGGILADEMGLGKTITMLSLMLAAPPDRGWENSEPLRPVSRGTLLICPPSVVNTWEDQIKAHIDPEDPMRYYVFHGPQRNDSINHLLKFEIIITTYSTLAQEFKTGGRRNTKRRRNNLNNSEDESTESEDDEALTLSSLHRILWHRVVLDEAHFIKEPTTLQAKAIYLLDADRRWCVTGTPLQNKLDDLYSLVRFLRIPPFNDRVWWQKNILKAMLPDDGMMKLKTLVKCITLRRTKKQKLNGKPLVDLPPKNDSIWFIELEGSERSLYDAVFSWGKKTFQKFMEEGTVLKHYTTILEIFLRLRQICAHSALCSDNALIKSAINNYAPGAGGDLVVDDDLSAENKFTPQHARQIFGLLEEAGDDICIVCGCDFDDGAGGGEDAEDERPTDGSDIALLTKCSHLMCRRCFNSLKQQQQQQSVQCPLCMQSLNGDADVLQVKPWPLATRKSSAAPTKKGTNKFNGGDEDDSLVSQQQQKQQQHTTMFTTSTTADVSDATLTPAEQQRRQQEQLRALQNSLYPARPLDRNEMSAKFKALINDLTTHFNSEDQSPNKSVVFSQWTGLLNLLEPHLKEAQLQFTRLDGSLTLQARQTVVTRFRSDKRVAVMLMSLKAGGVGLDLCCANRIYLLDPWWNPSVEQQAIDRVHRLGQTKPVETVRLFIKGSIEENILALQEKKANMAKEALNDQDDSEDKSKNQTADDRKRVRLADLKFLFHDRTEDDGEAVVD